MATATESLEHPLPVSAQQRNVIVFSACTALQYMAGPLLYVGPQQGALCATLGASPLVANLPEIAFSAMTITPAFLAWWLPGVTVLKRILAACYLVAASALALVAVALVLPVSNTLRIAAVILQGAAIGATVPTAIALMGSDWSRSTRAAARAGAGIGVWHRPVSRGGGGPPGAGTSQRALVGTPGEPLAPPWNSVAVFGGGVPLLLTAAVLSLGLEIPPAAETEVREPILTGLAQFLRTPVLARATIVTILLYIGNTIAANMNLYTEMVLSGDAQSYVNYQYAIRFGCKGLAGILLGWLMTRSHPRAGIVVTGVIFALSLLWALCATGPAYLVAFGIFGAGELVGVYAPNYILSASSPRHMRRNMAFVTMMMAPAAPAGYLFGAIANSEALGRETGLRLSFVACAAIIVAGVGLALWLLPKSPVPDGGQAAS